MSRIRQVVALILMAAALLASVGLTYAQTGSGYDLSWHTADGGGNQVGSTVTDGNVSVGDGYFSVELDFGSSAERPHRSG